MHPLLSEWLSELRQTPLIIGPADGSGGAENVWSLSIPPARVDIGETQMLEFLDEAFTVRSSQARAMRIVTAVFYAWHDEMAGQLRFSVARGTVADLPFGAHVERVSDLGDIVRSYLGSKYRQGIPWEELAEVPVGEEESRMAEHVVRVWARELT